jgi:hypothetical protein
MVEAEATSTKRYNLVLPQALYQQLQEVADERHTTVLELIKRFIRLGLLAVQAEDDPNLDFIVRENGVEKRLLVL